MAKLSKEYTAVAELASLLYNTVLENLQNSGRPVMARNIELGDSFFSDDPAQKTNPEIKKYLGKFSLNNRVFDLWLCSEINWYAPGKIYAGLKISDAEDQEIIFSEELKNQLKNFFGELISSGQEPVDGWICWRYITINGDTTTNTGSGAIPHFKVPNDALVQLNNNEKIFTRFATVLLNTWNDYNQKALELIKK